MFTSLRQLTFNMYFDGVSARILVFHSLPKFACSSCRFWVWLNVLWCDYGRLDMLVSSTCISNLLMYLVHCLIRIAVVARFSGGITESHCWEISHTSLHSQQLFSSHFRLFFYPFFSRGCKTTHTPVNTVTYKLLKAFELFRVWGNCHNSTSLHVIYVRRNATGSRVGVRVSVGVWNRRRERVRVPAPYA